MTPDLRARCAKLSAKFNGGISFPEDIADLAQLYHDGYQAGLEEAAKFADEVGDYETMDWCRTRATELKKESDHG